ncbi:MAG: ATP-dependent sacrificial sulfur transferase LarE [Dictyoglomaceae bacterium]
MNELLKEKLEALKELLKSMRKVAIAFSGGVDSTFLLKVARDVLGDNVMAITLVSPLYPKREIKEAKEIARTLGVKHIIEQEESILKNSAFLDNPPNRCYLCKKEEFEKILDIAKKHDISYVLDGSNKDDLEDYRPGREALKELGVRSPLLEIGFTKREIRELSKEFGLPTYDKPSLACLASRFPYGQRIDVESLRKIDEAEEFLRDLGIKQVRVRNYKDMARIEVDKESFRLFFDDNIRRKIVEKFKELGYIYITLDLEGYRTGSMNEVLWGKKK